MILQNPMTSLDPLFTIGNQLGEVLATRCDVPAAQLRAREVELLRSVHMTAPEERLRQYPHELSGGMRQRVLIAMASATAPKLLLADEPTTALDATIQEEILVLFREIRDRRGTAIAIVTHDLGVIRRICDRIVIMYAGRIVEEGPVDAVFDAPRHPYTRALLASIPVLDGDRVHAAIDRGPGAEPRGPRRFLSVRRSLPDRRRPVPRAGAAGGRVRRPAARVLLARGRDLVMQPDERTPVTEATEHAGRVTRCAQGIRGATGESVRRAAQGGRRRRRRIRDPRRVDLRPRRRIGQRQEHDRPDDPEARATRRWRGPVRRSRTVAADAGAGARLTAAPCRRCCRIRTAR